MKFLFAVAITVIVFSISMSAQNTAKPNDQFDAELAKRLGADDYGMKKYIFAILKKGKAEIKDQKELQNLHLGHMKNIIKLTEEGKLVVVGPFLDGQEEMQGFFVFAVATVDEAKKLVETDPAVKAGLYEVEYHPWYGSAALPEILPVQKKIQKKKFVE